MKSTNTITFFGAGTGPQTLLILLLLLLLLLGGDALSKNPKAPSFLAALRSNLLSRFLAIFPID